MNIKDVPMYVSIKNRVAVAGLFVRSMQIADVITIEYRMRSVQDIARMYD